MRRELLRSFLRAGLVTTYPAAAAFLPTRTRSHAPLVSRTSLHAFSTMTSPTSKKRVINSPSSSDEEAATAHGGSDKVLDPKLAEKGDVSDEELSQPARKKSKKEPAASSSKSGSSSGGSPSKSSKYGHGRPGSSVFNPGLPSKVTPLQDLKKALSEQGKDPNRGKGKGGHVIYWQRNKDLRISDNRALSLASHAAQENGKHLIALHILSVGDYVAHDRSARRIDFILRNLRIMQRELHEKYRIPLVVITHEERETIVEKVLSLASEWGATALFGNTEYEVDELWRDAALIRKGKGKLHSTFVDDCYVVPPGAVTTKEGKPYSVFSPWCRSWTNHIAENLDLLEAFDVPKANEQSVKNDAKLGKLFDSKVPDSVKGFECKDSDYMSKLWPAGEEAAEKVLDNFFQGKGGLKMLEEPATAENTPKVDDPKSTKKGQESRISRYAVGRNLMNENGTSHISPYLAAGVVSARECMRRVKKLQNNRLNVGRDSGPAMWATECAFRDFYGHVLAAWPRVCMGRAYVLRYEGVVWEEDDAMLKAWQEGKTGYPIVDASMRQCAKQGYMHNRGRMMAAMFLTKHLMHDWRHGERWFMQNFIDGDFASNNGGWQWSASTGTDPAPYFRIMSPLSQSEKIDPDGEYIRHWVPELRDVKGAAIHAPYDRLSKAEFAKLGYPKPIVEHKAARERAIRRFKEVGSK